MSSKRPGTVDYSKWDNFECSDSESEEDDRRDARRAPPHFSPVCQNNRSSDESFSSDEYDSGDDDSDDYDSGEDSDYTGSEEESMEGDEDTVSYEDGSGSDDESEDHPTSSPRTTARAPIAPAPSLQQLQNAWYTNVSAISRPCAHCFSPNAGRRCARCQLVRYCGNACQRMYHPIHRLECIDAGKHASYWGVFNKKKGNDSEETNNFVVLRQRRTSKRRRALQRAAAAAAIERARRARMARGGEAKGGGKGKGAEEREENCFICDTEFTVQGDGGVAFCCPTSHYMCNECTGAWVNSVMGDLETSYPPKCSLCKGLISKEMFERQLSTTQQNMFRTHAAKTALKPGEELIECKECGLFEVVTDDPVLWWCPHCENGNCRVCQKDLPPGVEKYDIETSPHKMCSELREPKELIEQAIEEGSKMRCPCCKLAGRKDDACTHMTCAKCSTEWCYVCGLDTKCCDKEPPRPGGKVNDIYLHNRDWEVNPKRCPMYLTQILEVDLNWMGENWEENATDEDFEDDERCLDYLHRFRTIKLLQAVLEKIGKKAFLGAFVAFSSIKNCGYTYNEIISTCTETLIDREEFIQSRGQSSGEVGIGNGQPALAFMPEGGGATNEEEDIDLEQQVEERLVSEALQRSEASAAEEAQIREVLERSAEEAGREVV